MDLQNNNKIIYISNEDYNKINYIINTLNKKYSANLEYVKNQEINCIKNNLIYNSQELTQYHIQLIKNIIKDVLNYYKDDLPNLELCFLSGSFARETNKYSSDLDLHFYYKDNLYNYKIEEIINYIISKVIKKNRDVIDPVFILNVDKVKRKEIMSLMDNSILDIKLKCDLGEFNYTYSSGKKNRFWVQYVNSRNIYDLKNYILNEILNDNREWAHCFNIIYDKNDAFKNLYDDLLNEEKSLINQNYINSKIEKLSNDLKDNSCVNSIKISLYKRVYQSKHFDLIYEYLSIIRFLLINMGENVKYLKFYELSELSGKKINSYYTSKKIMEYFMEVKKLAQYCINHNIKYGLHTDDIINYDHTNLDIKWDEVKNSIEKVIHYER